MAGFVSYEAAPAFDPGLTVRVASDPFADLPFAWFGVFKAPTAVPTLTPSHASYSAYRWEPSVPRDEYERQVDAIRELIADGETYQVNHTIRLHGRFSGSDRAFYTALALAQRGGHCCYLDLGRYRILSASPELFFRIDGDRLTTRPMKGTAPRGRTPEEDRMQAAALRATAKEQAENAMIVDLLRNDMGRISKPGSVEVTELFELERYETVWQMTSTIASDLVPSTGLPDVFGALFPSGSVTGAPKKRSMEVIADLETTPRGVYCGAIGWAAPTDGSADPEMPGASFNVAIRTVVLDTATDTVEYGVGSGITFDSDPGREYRECIDKTRVLTTRRPTFHLLETIAYREGAFIRMHAHLERMAASAAYLGFAFDNAAASKTLHDAAIGGQDRVFRLTCSRDGAITVATHPLPAPASEPVRLAIDQEPVDHNEPMLFHKTTLREPYDKRQRRHADADQVVLINRRGEVTETDIANIAIQRDGSWVTPALDCGLLPGIERSALLAEGKIREGIITPDDLRAAPEVVVFNSVRGWQVARLA